MSKKDGFLKAFAGCRFDPCVVLIACHQQQRRRHAGKSARSRPHLRASREHPIAERHAHAKGRCILIGEHRLPPATTRVRFASVSTFYAFQYFAKSLGQRAEGCLIIFWPRLACRLLWVRWQVAGTGVSNHFLMNLVRDVGKLLKTRSSLAQVGRVFCERVRVGQGTFEPFLATADQPGTEIHKPIIGTPSFDDVGSAPKIPGICLAAELFEARVKGGDFLRRERPEFLRETFGLLVDVTVALVKTALDDLPEMVFRHIGGQGCCCQTLLVVVVFVDRETLLVLPEFLKSHLRSDATLYRKRTEPDADGMGAFPIVGADVDHLGAG